MNQRRENMYPEITDNGRDELLMTFEDLVPVKYTIGKTQVLKRE
jgi:hypothetical protein